MGDFLVISLIASVVLTVLLNVGLRLWPREKDLFGGQPEGSDPFGDPPPPTVEGGNLEPGQQQSRPRVQVFFPWKAMLGISIGLTILVNVIAALGR